ncbi:M64 family metallopeptidase [Planctomycetota bacterium]|nr:M64 family metallopeptidase [Planctomycetota bacterium]
MPENSKEKLALYLHIDGKSEPIKTEGLSVISIGRSDECTLSLDIPKISRTHAEIRIDGSSLRLIDKRSANGTLLNGDRVDTARLRPGDKIQIGKAVIEVKDRTATASSRSRQRSQKKAGATAGTKKPNDKAVSRGEESSEKAPRTSRSSSVTLTSKFADVSLFILLFVLVALVVKEYSGGPKKVVINAPSPGVETGVTNEEDALPRPLDDGEVSLKLLEQEMADGELSWDAIESLRSISQLEPDSRVAETCLDLANALEGVRKATLEERTLVLEEVLTPMILEQRLGEAAVVSRFLSRVDSTSASQKYWVSRSDQIGILARKEIRQLDEEVSGLLNLRRPGEALRVVAAARMRFSGFDEFEGMLSDLVEGLADLKLKEPPRRRTPPREWNELLSKARLYIEECRYSDLSPVIYRALSLDLPSSDHIEALEMLVKAGALAVMFDEFIEGASGGDLSVTLLGEQRRILRATREGVELEREIAGGKQVVKKTWLEVTSTDKSKLFRSVPHSIEGVMGLVFLAEIAGNDEEFHRSLVNLHRRKNGDALAESILEKTRGGIPAGSEFVEFDGRLVTKLEQQQILEDRQLKREREKEAIAQARRLQKSQKIDVIVDYVRLLREQGSFSLADQMLREVIAKSDDAEQSAEARKLLADPYLAQVKLRDHGDPANRIDMFVLGDGYQVDDAQQSQFLNHAKTCERLLFAVDPYREYEQYFNFSAIHVQSVDQGVTREPGDIVRDTALGCTVRYDVLTSNAGKVFSITDRLGISGQDRQTVVIANDAAGVATGGGGVASLPKGAIGLVNHEVGHSFGGLNDEYDNEPGSDPEKAPPPPRDAVVATREAPPNLMHGSDKADVASKVIWQEWIDAEELWWNNSTVGLFEGGDRKPFHVWRPQLSCMMRDLSGFCVVCMEHMVKQIYRRVRPVDKVEPEPGEWVLEKKDEEEVILKVWTLQPRTHDLDVTWRVLSYGLQKPAAAGGDSGGGLTSVKDERLGEVWRRSQSGLDPEGKTVRAAQLRSKDLEPGWHRVRCTVHDPTPWVIRDDEGLLTQELEWWVEVRP